MDKHLAIRLVSLVGFFLLTAPSLISGTEFYVSPSGRAGASGTIEDPWSLAAALAHPGDVRPGDTIWLRGGRYGNGGGTIFVSRLSGSRDKPIVVRQFPGERATVDGGIDASGSYVWFWGFEITNSSPQRTGDNATTRRGGLNLLAQGKGNKAINLIVNNVGHPGIGFWSQQDGGEIHGCLIWANGLYDSSFAAHQPFLIRGSGIYAQNDAGSVEITDNISFWNFTTGMKAYGERGRVQGFTFSGNISFNNGTEEEIFVGVNPKGQPNPIARLKVMDNHIYRNRPGGGLQVGYKGDNLDAVVRDNYVVAGHRGTTGMLFARKFSTLDVTGNTVAGPGRVAHFHCCSGMQPSAGIRWNNNRYFGGENTAGRPFQYLNNQTGVDTGLEFDDWQSTTGFDLGSGFAAGRPKGVEVFVRPNRYEGGRGHIAVYNWDEQLSADVDLTGILTEGAPFEIRDAENYFGMPVVTGVYDGSPVRIPLDGSAQTMVIGEFKRFKAEHTGLQFGAFVVIGKPASGGSPRPAVAAGGVLNAASNDTSANRVLAPGSLISIYGSNLTSGGALVADAAPLPVILGGTSVYVNGTAAPLYYVSPDQINAQLPHELSPTASITVEVKAGNQISTPEIVYLGESDPGLFALAGDGGRPGDVVSLYATGLGKVDPPIATGAAAPLSPLSWTVQQPEVRFGLLAGTILFSGLAPTFVGLYQVNAAIPMSANAGATNVYLTLGGRRSNSLVLNISE